MLRQAVAIASLKTLVKRLSQWVSNFATCCPIQNCVQGAVGDELHMVFECPHLQSLRDEFSHLFGPTTTDMRSFFSQQDKVGVINFTLNALGLMT